ncbi:hypothetical protein A2397_00985 [Candidatus Amesbacteria bacterium RIFOXYB1_FULL_44_23]|uniref:Uncharacterized protein n=1 Tax=Candidatus Amesbacteria bacterium RIFOXYB1_FULL_44_23 TaxID=1797263 RepID=A0A1F4ZQY5_9BACT|nr:MAG: hypothetical protein A2397_00985 [Candidatus Amesbacteria bacterium RIFOXYB1_FULL_44_23]
MSDQPLVTPLNPTTLTPEKRSAPAVLVNPKTVYLALFAVVVVGVLSGFLLSKTSSPASTTNSSVAAGDVATGKNEVGSTDTKTFRDTATGTLEAGGSNGKGTHKLIRPGGVSQTVYLVSSIVDLDEYVGKKVEVWGETLKAKEVGWLMDVGRLKILE